MRESVDYFAQLAYEYCDEARVACEHKVVHAVEFLDISHKEAQQIIQLAKDTNLPNTDWQHDEDSRILVVTITEFP